MNINDFMATLSAADGIARQNRYRVIIPTDLLTLRSNDIWSAIENSGVYDQPTDWVSDFMDVDMQACGIELMAFCEHSQLPGYQFATVENRHYGPAFKVPHLPQYQEVTMTFMCGATMWERYLFDTWMYMVMDPLSNDFNYMSEYAVDIDIVQYPDKASSYSFSVGLAGQQIANQLANFFLRPRKIYPGVMPGRLTREKGIVYEVEHNYRTTLIDAYPVSINAQELGFALNDTYQTVQVTFAYKYAIPFWGKGSTLVTPARGEQEQFKMTVQGIGSDAP